MRRIAGWLLAPLLYAATFFLGAPTVIALVGDHGRTYFVLAVAVLPLLALPLVVLLGVQLLLKRRLTALVTAALVAVNAYWQVPLWVGDPVPEGAALTAMTANMRLGLGDADALVRLVTEKKVDVLAVEELTPDLVARLREAGLDKQLPYSRLDARLFSDGCGLWSRYPLAPLPDFEARFASPGAVVRTPGQDVAVRVLHPWPTTLTGGGGMFREDYARLTRQVRALDATPTLLMGDLNATTDVQALRDLMGDRFRDAPEVAGDGPQRTWSPGLSWPPLLHLDHVLVDRGFGVRGTEVVDLDNSDHDGVVARLTVR